MTNKKLVGGGEIMYKTICIDPPWNETGGGRIKRGADRHYSLLKDHEILQEIIKSGVFDPDENCHLYLWVTNNFLESGLLLMKALGFRYVTNLVWVKDRIGLGQYFRGQHELLLFGVKGRLPAKVKNVPTVILAARSEHSRKPEVAYAMMEAVSHPPRLEMFARRRRLGWYVWGDEVNGSG